jgi:hypothetical protein
MIKMIVFSKPRLSHFFRDSGNPSGNRAATTTVHGMTTMSDQDPNEPPDLWLESAKMKLHLGILEMRDALAHITWTSQGSTLSQARIGPYLASVMFHRTGDAEIPAGWSWRLDHIGRIIGGKHGIADEGTAQQIAETAMRAHYYG